MLTRAKFGWLRGIILGIIAFIALALPLLSYIYSHEDTFFVTGYLGSRELYTTDTEEIQTILIQDYPEAENGDFVRVIDTDTDWDFVVNEETGAGVWTDFNFMHAYVSTNDFLFAFIIGVSILGLVFMKALKSIDKYIAFPIWTVMIAFMLLFLKGILAYMPQLLFSVAGGWTMFYILIKIAKRQFDISREYANEKVRKQARDEA